MTATFLVTLQLDELSQLPLIAEQIHDDLAPTHDVIKVVPWARPNNPEVAPAGGFTSLKVPPQV